MTIDQLQPTIVNQPFAVPTGHEAHQNEFQANPTRYAPRRAATPLPPLPTPLRPPGTSHRRPPLRRPVTPCRRQPP